MNKAWEKGKRDSLSFYFHKLKEKAKQFNRVFPLPDYFDEMIGDEADVKIADLGAGLFCTIGSTWPTAIIHITASDLLADDFNKMLAEANIVPIIPIEKQNMEDLPYPDNLYDIVHCTNALDHTPDPFAALIEMQRICKPGGWIYLRHYAHVGKHQNYCGLHMWNIDYHEPDDCRIWNETGSMILSKAFPGFVTECKRVLPYEPENMVVSMFQKPL